jgi:hypothetical protein
MHVTPAGRHVERISSIAFDKTGNYDKVCERQVTVHVYLLSLFGRASLGILLILNGPANALAIGLVSVRSSCCSGHTSPTPRHEKQSSRKCCGRCSDSALAKTAAADSTPKNKIRPTCPLCPSCPNFPGGCCVSCPCKSPCAPPLAFVMPESPELVWRLADVAISFFDSDTDEPTLLPRFSQFVAFTI